MPKKAVRPLTQKQQSQLYARMADRKRKELDFLETVRKANKTLDEDAIYYPQLPPTWKPRQAFQSASQATTIIPAPYQVNMAGFNPYASASNTVSTAVPQSIAQAEATGKKEALEDIPQEDEELNMEGIATDEPAPVITTNPFEEEDTTKQPAELPVEEEDMDLSEFDDFGTGRLFGNGVSGRRMMNHRRRMYY